MRYLIISVFFVFLKQICFAQSTDKQLINTNKIEPNKAFDNVLITNLESDSLSSSFIIWIKKEVKLHRHNLHTENVYVIEGSGTMTLGTKVFEIKQGDHVFIPKGTPHKVKVNSSIPLKILSIQSPNFDGKDREMLE